MAHTVYPGPPPFRRPVMVEPLESTLPGSLGLPDTLFGYPVIVANGEKYVVTDPSVLKPPDLDGFMYFRPEVEQLEER